MLDMPSPYLFPLGEGKASQQKFVTNRVMDAFGMQDSDLD